MAAVARIKYSATIFSHKHVRKIAATAAADDSEHSDTFAALCDDHVSTEISTTAAAFEQFKGDFVCFRVSVLSYC